MESTQAKHTARGINQVKEHTRGRRGDDEGCESGESTRAVHTPRRHASMLDWRNERRRGDEDGHEDPRRMKRNEGWKSEGTRTNARSRSDDSAHDKNSQKKNTSETHTELDQHERVNRVEWQTRRQDAAEMRQRRGGNENERRIRGNTALLADTRKTPKSKTSTRHSYTRATKRVTRQKKHPLYSTSTLLSPFLCTNLVCIRITCLSTAVHMATWARDGGYDEWRDQNWCCDHGNDQERERRMDHTESGSVRDAGRAIS